MQRLYYIYAYHSQSMFHSLTLVASSRTSLRQQLLQQELYPIKIKKGGYYHTSQFKSQELLSLTRQLATMLDAGLPLVNSVKLLSQEHHLPCWRYLLHEIAKQLEGGVPLSQIITAYPAIFPALYRQLISTGELSGQFSLCFDQLAQWLANKQYFHQQLKQHLRYPLFLCLATAVISALMLFIVLPQFETIYSQFAAPLPPYTVFIIQCAQILKQYGLIGILLISSLRLTYHLGGRPFYRRLIEHWQLQLPLVGTVIKLSQLALFFQALATIQRSGLPLLLGLETTQTTLTNRQIKAVLSQISEEIKRGESFSEAIAHQAIFPPLCYQFILAGEATGDLTQMLEQLAHYYQAKLSEYLQRITKLAEPSVMVLLSIVVGGLIMALYLPIFQLSDVLH